MANANANFNLNIKTKVDSVELNRLKTELQEIRKLMSNPTATEGMGLAQIRNAISASKQLEQALTSAYDVNLNTINIDKFNRSLKKSGTDLREVQEGLTKIGPAGQKAFVNATTQLFSFNKTVKQSNQFLDKMATTMANTVRWNITSSILNTITGSIHKAYGYVKDLDSGLNDIRIVTGKSADEMARFAEQANEAAKALATTTTDYTEGALIYYQQGLDDKTVTTLTDITAKTSNVTGQGMDTVSEQLTAVWNGYQVANQAAREGMQVYEEYVDKMAAVGATTASNLEELATAMSKVASAASSMGVGFDELNAQIATIVSVTRQAPESIGTALKTIYARLGDLKVDGVDEFGTSLGDVSGQLQMMGIDVVDMNGDMRDMDVVMTEVAEKWNTWTDAQRQAAAVAMAGKRQYNNLIALFDNWDMYTETLETAQNAAGTLDKQQSIALDSLKNKLDILKATSEDLYDSLFDEESLKDLVDDVIPIVQALADMTDALGGLQSILPMVLASMTKLFSPQIAKGMMPMVHNMQAMMGRDNSQQMANQLNMQYQTKIFTNQTGLTPEQVNLVKEMSQYYADMYSKINLMDDAQVQQYKEILNTKKAVIDLDIEIEKVIKEFEQMAKNIPSLKRAFGEIINEDELHTVQETVRILETIQTTYKKGISKQALKTQITKQLGPEVTKIFDENLQTVRKEQGVKNKVAATEKQLKEALQRTIDQSYSYASKREKQFESERQKAIKKDNSTNMQKDLNKDLNLQQTLQNITKTVGAIGQLGSAITMLKNLGSIWSAEDVELGDKILQTVTNLAFVLPMLTSGFKTFADVLGITTTFTGAYTTAMEAATIGTSKFGIVMNAVLKTITAHPIIAGITAAILILTAAFTAFNIASKKYTASLERETKVAERRLEQSKKQLEIAKQQKQAVDDLVNSYKNLAKSFTAGELSIDDLRIKTYDLCLQYGQQDLAIKALVADYEQLNSVVYEAQKIANKEEINANKEVLNSTKLAIKRKTNERKSRIKDWGAVEDNGNIDIDYESDDYIANAISGLGTGLVAGGGYVTAAGLTATPTIVGTVPGLAATALGIVGTGAGSGLIWLGSAMGAEDNQKDAELQNLLINDYGMTLTNGSVSQDEFFKAAVEDYDRFISDLEEIDSSESKELIKILEENKENIEEVKQLEKEINKLEKESIALDYAQAGISDVKEYYEAIQNMMQEVKDQKLFEEDKDAYDWATNALQKYLEDPELAIDYEIFQQLAEELGYTLENLIDSEIKIIEDKIKEFNSSEKNLIYLYLETAKAKDSLETFLNEIKNLADYENREAIVNIIDDILSSENFEQLTEEQLDSLFGGVGNLDTFTKYTKEDLVKMSSFDQSSILLQTALDYQKYKVENKEVIQAEVQALVEQLQDIEGTYAGKNIGDIQQYGAGTFLQDEIDNVSNMDTRGEILDFLEEQKLTVDSAQALLLENPSKLSNAEKEIVNTLKNKLKIQEEDIEKVKEYIPIYEDYSSELAMANGQLAEASNLTAEYSKYLEIIKTKGKNASESLSNLSSNFGTLSSFVTEFSKTGTLSLNSISTLLQMDNDSISVLEFQNGQLAINEARVKEIAKAKLVDAQSTVMQRLQTQLLMIQEGKASEANIELTKTNALLAASMEEAGSAAQENALVFAEYVATLTGIDLNSLLNGEEYQIALNRAQKEMALIQDTMDNLDTTNFSAVMGASDFEDIYDRYWTINKTLEEIENTLEDLDEIQSHLHGKALIESLEKENKLLEEQEKTYNKLYEAQKVEAAELRGQLSQYGVMFQDGNIVNYDAAVKGLNASQYEAFQELFERYDELFYSEMVDTLNKIEEINYERLANELEAFEVQLELNLETTEAERALDEFTKELNKDFKSVYENFDEELKHIVDSYNTYIRKNGTIDSIISAIQTVQKEIDALRDNDDTTDSTMFATVGDAQEKLKELQEQLQDATLESRDLMEEYWDTYLDSIDQAAEKFEELSEEFDAINDELDYQRELIELIYGPEAYGMQKQIFDAQINNSLAQVDSARQQVDLWQSYYDQAEEGTEEQLKYAELLKEAQAELNDLTLEHIQLLKDDYANTMDDILTKLEKDITGGLGLDDMREEWEEAVKESEKYYDNIERIFELETLENKFQNAIDNTASPKYQQAIKDLMEDQLATLKDKEQLTEYDVQLAEKRLGILQAEAALEDAQNAKNAMKLVRGASGNWEYQYVADTSDIENKQQALRESYQELYEFAKDAQLDSIEALMEAKDDYITKLHEIKDDETLSEEEKLIKIAEINDKYWNEEEGIITKLQQDYYNKTQTLSTASAESLLGLYKADESAYYDMTEYEKGLVDEFKHHAETSYTDMYLAIQEEYKQDQEKFDSYVDSNLLHWQTAASDMAAAWNGDEDSIRTNVNEAYESISDATTEYSLELERLEATSGDSFGEEGIAGDIKTAIDYTNTLKTKTGELVDLANSRLPEYKSQIEKIDTAWTNVANKIDNASKQLKYYLELAEVEVPEPTYGDGSGSVGGGNNTTPGGGGTPDEKVDNPFVMVPTHYKVKENILAYPISSTGFVGSGEYPSFPIDKNIEVAILGKYASNSYKVDLPPYDNNIDAVISEEDYKNKLTQLDTGGYTGDWSGGEGRMAMLHSKELVLNKVDTENILNAVSAVRDMTGITSSVGSAIMQNIKAMIMEVLGISAGTGRATRNTNNETSNVFHITAEFPNANSVETIQEAILSLPNIASQYVAENRR